MALIREKEKNERGNNQKSKQKTTRNIRKYRFCGSKSNYEYRKLSDICRQITEAIEPSQYPNQEFAYYSIPNFDATGSFTIEQAKNIKSNKFVVCENDLLVSKLNPWFNRVILADRNSICSTEFVVLRADNSYLRNYIYAIAISQPFVSYCSSNATGTSNSHKRINPDLMMEYKTKYNVDAAETFGKTIAPYIKNVINIVNQNLILASTRDFLLPLLINGQVSMKRKEKEYE